ncbi:sulfite exporter TauE/SafE family protein [Paenibacillus sp. 1011MAR3C5]|uniref:sulfite exporter TauE/SafE family protein n=1 Tax=Paenibacillus sp. 1011MAR3C5 TaxID=1675787 RepID=UPI000E6D3D19|nr:sulfite exporter TauE/SafE family protein [Paenibacillus sp. 1011MAR3C5]RJE84367.1 sulfite exporter TauE/SafE family protein [Paenibacillus sp. 1011MAR3C5]
MNVEIGWLVTLFAIGFIGSFLSGMVGIGGSIIKYPMLLYIPPALGFAAFTAQEVSAVSAAQVFFASLAGLLAYRKGGWINKELILYMGIPIVLGSFLGGFGSKFLSNSVINMTYAILALVAAVMMFMPKRGEEGSLDKLSFNKPLAAGSAAAVGILSGIVGAAGAFITLPIMLVLLRIPTRVAIASSLAITFLSSIGSVGGKLMGGHMLLIPSIVMIVASIIGSPIGAKLGQRMNVKVLQWLLSLLITATVVKIWWDILG